jgi:hypothetical protein
MFDLSSLLHATRDPGLPASMLRPNSGPADFPFLPGPISEEKAIENVNAAPWSKRFAANFIEPGLVLYKGKDGRPDEWLLIEAPTLERMAKSLIGKPVIDWNHAEVWPEILGDGQADGVVYDVWKGENGWWHCGYILWTKSAIEHAESGEWSVSCAYDETENDGQPGKHHNIPYTYKLLNGVYTHLAQVKKPRYEDARIRANSTENGGYKMAWSIFAPKKKEEKVLRLNAADGAGAMLEVDGEPVALNELVAKHNAMHSEHQCMTASDDDVVEHEGKQYKVGELRNAHRAHAAAARQNAEDERAKKEKEEKERKERENAARANGGGARANAETQLTGAKAEPTGKLAGQGGGKADGPADNPDVTVEAAKELAAAKERLNSLEAELKTLKNARSTELREAAHLRIGPVGGAPEDQGFVGMEDRIRAGAKDFALS